MRVQSTADMLLGPGARDHARVLASGAPQDSRARAKRADERQKRPSERDRSRAEPGTGLAEDAPAAIGPGSALASMLAHLGLTAVREAQVSRGAAIEAYAETE